MTLRMRLPGGTLKFKSYRDLRTSERENAVPVWKIGSLHLHVNFVAPYERGWARLRGNEGLVQSEASRAFPPDRGPSVSYQPFPAVEAPDFQARNPVTGRPVGGGSR